MYDQLWNAYKEQNDVAVGTADKEAGQDSAEAVPVESDSAVAQAIHTMLRAFELDSAEMAMS